MEKIKNASKIEWREATKNEKEGDFTYQIKEITDEELAAIGPNATREALARYNCTAVSWYRRVHNGKTTTVHSSDEYPIFVMENENRKTVYQPRNPDKKFRYFLFNGTEYGWEKINGINEMMKAYEEHDNENAPEPKVMICANMRDALNMAGLGYYTLWTQEDSVFIDIKVFGRMINGQSGIELSEEFKKLLK